MAEIDQSVGAGWSSTPLTHDILKGPDQMRCENRSMETPRKEFGVDCVESWPNVGCLPQSRVLGRCATEHTYLGPESDAIWIECS